jgi:predicted phosphodiesterase
MLTLWLAHIHLDHINPGTANGWFLGYKATAAIFDTTDRHIEFINL